MAMAFSTGASIVAYSGSAIAQFSARVGESFASGSSNRAIRLDSSTCGCNHLRQRSFTFGDSGWKRWGNASRGRNDREARPVRTWKVEASVVPEGGLDNRVPEGGLDNTVTFAKGLSYDGPGRGGEWLSSTTRHVRIYIGVADPVSSLMDQSQLDKVTLMLDPDNEFVWPDDKTQKVFDYFRELLDVYAGAPCTEYTLRLIGSDIEHFIRKMLLANEIKYNLDCRVLNFSMGKPRYADEIPDEEENNS